MIMVTVNQINSSRDSGSKLTRMKMARQLHIGDLFKGVVLSSEANTIISPMDKEIVSKYGVAGINCSWNRYGFKAL